MDYKLHYNTIVNRGRNRVLSGYKESHHVIPKCLGGSDEVDNLVDLTAREHYVAHILLAKIYGGKLWHAVNYMGRIKRYSNRHYERARLEHSKLVSANNTLTKRRPKEIREYYCVECAKIFTKLEFCHYPKKEKPFCSRSCSAANNGRTSSQKRKGIKLPHLHGRPTWNKGLPNPTSAANGKKGSAKLSAKVTGRTRLYRDDGSWTWQYP